MKEKSKKAMGSGSHDDDIISCEVCGCHMKRDGICPDTDCGHNPNRVDCDCASCNQRDCYPGDGGY